MQREQLLLLLAALIACNNHDDAAAPNREPAAKPAAKPARPPQKLDTLTMAVPDGWKAEYDKDGDKWLFTTPPIPDGRTANARIERADNRAVASPDAYLHKRLEYWDKGTTAEIEKRESVKDGFAMTVTVKPAVDPAHPKREMYVVRQLGNVWYQCMSEWVPDDAMRDQLLALCKSLKL